MNISEEDPYAKIYKLNCHTNFKLSFKDNPLFSVSVRCDVNHSWNYQPFPFFHLARVAIFRN